MRKRVDIRKIMADPTKRRKLMVDTLIAIQATEGITTTREQAEAAYDRIQSALQGNLLDRWERAMLQAACDTEEGEYAENPGHIQ